MSDNYNEHTGSVIITDNPETTAFSEADIKTLEEQNATSEPNDEKILGKFNNQSDLENAYKELEKKLHEPSDNQVQADDDTPPELPSDEVSESSNEEESAVDEEEQSDPSSNEAREGIASAFEAMQEAGEVDEGVLEKFAEAGIPKELVEHVQELTQYKKANELKEVTSEVADYPALQKWAGDNLSESEISIFDNIVENGTLDEMRFAVNNLNGRMQGNTAPRQSRLIKADAIAQAEGGYESQAQMIADMGDPRYQKDSAYRAAVARKASKSNI
tara:strand:- start:456 stop:1277 length:822 start_codon:yes stop_codon:yes gene_type:complete